MNTYHIRNIGNFVLFRDKADRIFFNNKFAAICYNSGIEVLALCILSTHFHAVVCAVSENAIKELEHILKVAYGMHYRHKYGFTIGNRFKTRHTLIVGREMITDKLIYVMANPVHHYITESPFTYQFSSANYIFTQDYLPINFRRALTTHLTPFGKLPLSKQRQLVSKDQIPNDWLVDPDGFISPNSFINVPKSRAYFSGIPYEQCRRCLWLEESGS